MAIISASRRTDIPTYFSEWFIKRMAAGEVYTRNNPYNLNAVSHITFSPKDIDCICFWTKNPIPMIPHLNKLADYQYYFQYTLTGYESDVEPNLPEISRRVEAFKELSKLTGGRVVWRYDPIMFTAKYDKQYHIAMFTTIAKALAGYTNRCVISFVDLYPFVNENLRKGKIVNAEGIINSRSVFDFTSEIANIAKNCGMEVFTCGEGADLSEAGVKKGSCIDKELIESIIGYPLKAKKDTAQRTTCLCAESVDFGKYNTCMNGCKYCYANKCPSVIPDNLRKYDVNSPILCDTLQADDIITERPLKTLRSYEAEQLSLF